MTALMAMLLCLPASGHRRPGCHHRLWTPRPMVVVRTVPTTATRVSNHLTQNQRLHMALAYLQNNRYLTIKHYARMTGLSKQMAEAELDSFCPRANGMLRCQTASGKKVYSKI